jgi:putative SOS response-associated peptidase YedK
MCYSAQIEASYQRYVRAYHTDIDIETFVTLFVARLDNDRIKLPMALEHAFDAPVNAREAQIKGLIDQHREQQAAKFEQELFKQRARLADAERSLLSKTTKAATEAKRISSTKIAWCKGKLADLRRVDLQDQDSRIYPGYYAPVMVMQDGKRILKPMRYQCRPAGKPVAVDTQYPGTYNARRDNLEGYWKGQFGFTHGIMVVHAFFEHVERSTPEGLKKYQLEFKPRPKQDMLVACLWSQWTRPGEPDLLSFAAITDEPPVEIAQAGHDRCVIPLKPEHIDAWLNPDPKNLAQLYAILDDRERPYYEHRLAA